LAKLLVLTCLFYGGNYFYLLLKVVMCKFLFYFFGYTQKTIDMLCQKIVVHECKCKDNFKDPPSLENFLGHKYLVLQAVEKLR